LLAGEEACAEFSGRVIVEGGGFCGARGDMDEIALRDWDGIRLKVKGDGNRYKLNLRTKLKNGEEVLYQTSFETIRGEGSIWQDIFLPFEAFIPVVRNSVQYNIPRLETNSGFTLLSLSLIYSRFEYNRCPNPTFSTSPFKIRIKSISAYRKERPVFILISSAGTERNARIMDESERKKEIPIVQLNPGGILNWKYKGEDYLRSLGGTKVDDNLTLGEKIEKLPYVIIRPCGLVMPTAYDSSNAGASLEASQGDIMSGRLTREDVAKAVVASLVSPSATYCTLEVRRSEAEDDQGKATCWNQFFGGLVRDEDRVLNGLWPLPLATDPPPPVTTDRAKEILNDPRVRAQQRRDKIGGDGQTPIQGSVSRTPSIKNKDEVADIPTDRPINSKNEGEETLKEPKNVGKSRIEKRGNVESASVSSSKLRDQVSKVVGSFDFEKTNNSKSFSKRL